MALQFEAAGQGFIVNLGGEWSATVEGGRVVFAPLLGDLMVATVEDEVDGEGAVRLLTFVAGVMSIPAAIETRGDVFPRKVVLCGPLARGAEAKILVTRVVAAINKKENP